MIRVFLLSILMLVSACGIFVQPVAEYELGGPGPEIVARLEAKVVMPPGASPLSSYLRTYYPNGGKVAGLYLLDRQTGIRSRPNLDVMVMDGGCGVVTVVYDPVTDVIGEAYCNGVA